MKKLILFSLFAIFTTVAFASTPFDATPDDKKMMTAQLVGVWEFTSYPYHIIDNIHKCDEMVKKPGAFLSYTFREDGTYLKTYGDNQYQEVDYGFWEVSNDSQFIVMISAFKPDLAPQVVSIQMNEEKLIISEDFNIEVGNMDAYFCTALNQFSFEKKAEIIPATIN